jgi:hypothetical protein
MTTLLSLSRDALIITWLLLSILITFHVLVVH